MRSILALSLLAFACASARADRDWEAQQLKWRDESRGQVRAFLHALPHCQPAHDAPSVDAVSRGRPPDPTCVAVRGQLFHVVMDPCPMVLGGAGGARPICAQGWMLWDASRPPPASLDMQTWMEGIPVIGPGSPHHERCSDQDAEAAAIPAATRLKFLPVLGNGDVEEARREPRLSVRVVGTLESGALHATHLCVSDGPNG